MSCPFQHNSQEALLIILPPPLRPLLQLIVIRALPRHAPAEEFIDVGRLDARVCRAHETLTQVFEAVTNVRCPV